MPEPTNHDLTRRDFVKRTILTTAVATVTGAVASQSVAQSAQPAAAAPASKPALPNGAVAINWLEKTSPALTTGVALGVPWPRGVLKPMKIAQAFSLTNEKGEPVAVQSWPLAMWPDGSLKWTGHAVGPQSATAKSFVLTPVSDAPKIEAPLKVTNENGTVTVDTGVIRARLQNKGSALIELVERAGKPALRNGRLVALRQDRPTGAIDGATRHESFASDITNVTVEQSGPVRAVVKIDGKHKSIAGTSPERTWLPFSVRLYFHVGSDAIRIMHSFVFDGEAETDFISGLGIRFDVAMDGLTINRHIRFAGDGNGLWAECVQNLSGLRRDPGRATTDAQFNGVATPALDQIPPNVANRLPYIPAWTDFSLFQSTADGFQIRKRTPGKDVCWIDCGYGHRSPGTGYVGTPTGGVAFGLRDFWQRHPTQLDVRNAATENAEVTLWLWSPDAKAMDLRMYHDTMGMDTYGKQNEGLDITYEDFEPGWGTPKGIARSSEIFLWVLPATPTRERMIEFANAVSKPPALVCDSETYKAAQTFGDLWSIVDRSSPLKAKIEDQLDWFFDFYRKAVEQHHFYGFWNYGDVMHTYDPVRHTWRYDVGGFAWDNSELSPDLWLWYSFLRTGRDDIFRFAEALSRHTGEVDMYHDGPYKGLGTRHGVLHWSDSSKQLRVSTATNKRFYYYLTADERFGDLLRELLTADEQTAHIWVTRKVGLRPNDPNPTTRPLGKYPAESGFGTDWSAIAAANFTEWERTLDEKYKTKVVNGMKGIGAMRRGWFAGGGGYDPKTGEFFDTNNSISVSHLSAVFGAVEIFAELLMNLDVPEYEKAWLDYCTLYNATAEEQRAALGEQLRGLNLRRHHSRLTAYAAMKKKDPKLATRAWNEFLEGARGERFNEVYKSRRVEGPLVLNPVDEHPFVSTNGTAEWGLAAIQCLALVGQAIPKE